MLESHRKGYAVMNSKLTAYSFEDESLETCKRYCRPGSVIVEQIPYVCGFSIKWMWYKFYRPFQFRYYPRNILWLHWTFNKEYLHKTGKVVFSPTENKK